MNMRFHLLAALLLPICSAFADGIPVNRKTLTVTVPHTILELSEAQIEEIEILGSLTFNPDQWTQLRKIGTDCPKRINNVLPVTWEDCTCDMWPYAIQLTRSTVAITHSQLSNEAELHLSLATKEPGESIFLKIDRKGQFYYRGTLIPFSKLLTVITQSSGKTIQGSIPEERYLGIEYPLGLTRTSSVLKTRVDKIFAAAKKSGWRTEDDNRREINP